MEEGEETFELAFPEEDEEIRNFASQNNIAMLAIIEPYIPYKASPSRYIRAELDVPEEFAVESFIRNVKDTEAKCDKLHLLLHSHGGDVNSAYTIAKVLRKNFKEIIAFIPQIAASGATLIAIAANKIVMGDLSRLSPIDPIVYTPKGRESSLAIVRGFEKLHEKFERTHRDDIPYPYQHIIETVNLATYEERVGYLNMVSTYAEELLKLAGYKKELAKKIAKKLVFGYPAHYYIIDFDKAKELGLNVEYYSNFENEWRVMRKWLGRYILEESARHHVMYALPEKERGEKHES